MTSRARRRVAAIWVLAAAVAAPAAARPARATAATAATATAVATATATAATAEAEGEGEGDTVVTMAFSGDILPHRPILAQALTYGGGTYDFRPMFARIAPLLSSVDLAVCHLETPIAPPGEPLSFHPIYGVPRQIVDAIAYAGYDRCSTASNHALDRGTAGIDATVDALEAVGIGNAGMARTPAEAEPQVFSVKGVRFSQLDYTFGLNGLVLPADQPWRVRLLDADRIVADAREARRRGAEYVIVNLHWGREGDWQVSPEQRALADALTSSGAVDLIVGEHVHVLQPAEQRNGRWVVYGTSNLLSNLPGGDPKWPPSTQDGAIVTVTMTRHADGTTSTAQPVVHPTWVDHDGYVIRPVLGDLADPTTPAGVRSQLAASLARTRSVLGPYVATAPVGPVPLRCAVEPASAVPESGATVASGPAAYTAVEPVRIFDSRQRGDDGYVCPGTAVSIPVAGHGGVPATGATAVALNVTAIAAGGPGYATVWPTGTPRPTASSLNLTAVDQVRPNLVIVPLGRGGEVSVYAQSGLHLAVDVAGWFAPAAAPATAGRIVTTPPERLLDTRRADGPTGGARVGSDAALTVPVAGRAGVPATGVAAVVLSLTGTDATAAGFVTAWPAGGARPVVSNVNLAGPGDTAPNLAVVRLGDGGAVSLYAQRATHLVADVTGYVTDATAAPGGAGLFVPLAPARVFDTRTGSPAAGPVPAGGTVTVVHTGRAGLPDDGVGGVVLNVTGVDAAAAGYVTAWPAGPAAPGTSTLNLAAGDTRPVAAVLAVGTGGAVSYLAQSGAHLVVDASGYLTADPTPRPGPTTVR